MQRGRRGFMIFDGILAVSICGVLLGVVAVALQSQNKASGQLADFRTATRMAEEALARLQQGRGLPTVVTGDALTIDPIAGTTTPEHFKWVCITAIHNGRAVRLLGLAPDNGGGAKS